MRTLARTDIESLIDHADVVGLMRHVFAELAAGRVQLPERIALDGPGEHDTVLVMPAAVPAVGGLGTKVISIFPSNASRGLPTVSSTVVLLDAQTGSVRALLDGASITELRTSAASALATDILARQDAASLCVIGAGAQARHHVLAIASVRELRSVTIVSRTFERAETLCRDLRAKLDRRTVCMAAKDVPTAVRSADVIVTATTSTDPVFDGNDVQPGTHINAVGSYKPYVRELDDTTIVRSRVYVDILSHAMKEAGDLLDPIRRHIITPDHVLGDLSGLITGSCAGRQDADQVTLFKSVGAAIEDVIVAAAVCDRAERGVRS